MSGTPLPDPAIIADPFRVYRFREQFASLRSNDLKHPARARAALFASAVCCWRGVQTGLDVLA